MLFRSYRKRKALESYRYVLGPRLRGVYGRRDEYAADEVIATIRTFRLSETFICYALAMFCDKESFDAHHREHGDVACNYDRLWRELSQYVSYQRVAVIPGDASGEDIGDVVDAISHIATSHAGDAVSHAGHAISHGFHHLFD